MSPATYQEWHAFAETHIQITMWASQCVPSSTAGWTEMLLECLRYVCMPFSRASDPLRELFPMNQKDFSDLSDQ